MPIARMKITMGDGTEAEITVASRNAKLANGLASAILDLVRAANTRDVDEEDSYDDPNYWEDEHDDESE